MNLCSQRPFLAPLLPPSLPSFPLRPQVALDDDAADHHHLLSTGITERNIEVFLGVMEARVDEIVQVRNCG